MFRVEVVIDGRVHRDLAYRAWEARKRPLWDDHADWYKVEQQLLKDDRRIREQMIRNVAIRIWNERGRPRGQDETIWRDAESMLDRINPVIITREPEDGSNGETNGVATSLFVATDLDE